MDGVWMTPHGADVISTVRTSKEAAAWGLTAMEIADPGRHRSGSVLVEDVARISVDLALAARRAAGATKTEAAKEGPGAPGDIDERFSLLIADHEQHTAALWERIRWLERKVGGRPTTSRELREAVDLLRADRLEADAARDEIHADRVG